MNGVPFQPPPASGTLTLEGIIQIRLALDAIKRPSKEITSAITTLDKMIETIIASFQPMQVKS